MVTTLWEIISRFVGLFVWWTIVAPWEQAIRVRLGSRVRKLGPGIHFRIPHFDAIYRQTVRMRIMDLQLLTLSTSDGKTVTISATVGYHIEDILKLYGTLHHPDETVRNLAAQHISKVVYSRTLANCTPALIEEEANKKIDLSEYGLGSVALRIVGFAIVRTYRLLQDQRWFQADHLDTSKTEKEMRT